METVRNLKKEQKTKALIIEDSFIIRCILEERLVELGYSVDFVESAQAAFKMKTSDYKLILVDVYLPDMDAIDLLKSLKMRLSNSYVIPFSFPETKYREKCILKGLNDTHYANSLTELENFASGMFD